MNETKPTKNITPNHTASAPESVRTTSSWLKSERRCARGLMYMMTTNVSAGPTTASAPANSITLKNLTRTAFISEVSRDRGVREHGPLRSAHPPRCSRTTRRRLPQSNARLFSCHVPPPAPPARPTRDEVWLAAQGALTLPVEVKACAGGWVVGISEFGFSVVG